MRQFGIGQAVRRSEDPRFLTGRGRYAADITLPGQAHALFLRSPHAHADIHSVETQAAARLPGVLAVYTAVDVQVAGLGDPPCEVPVKDRDGKPAFRPRRPLLAGGRVRFVGDTVAMVVAETVAAARDALDLIEVDYAALPAVADTAAARRDGAPEVWAEAPGNAAFFWQRGNPAATERAFAEARHRVGLDLINNRVAPAPLEPRAVVGDFDAESGRFTLYTPTQGAHTIQNLLATETLKVAKDKIHVVVPDVGGAFGTKIFHYAEEVLTLWAARELRRPVKWVGDRSEAFTCDTHGRDHVSRAEAAVDGDGRVRAVRVRTTANMGAYLSLYAPMIPTDLYGPMISGAYGIETLHVVVEGVYTNTTPVDAYRGAGRPEATYLIERLMDVIAHDMGLGADEIRRRNFIRPEAMPCTTAGGNTYDCGDFARNMDDAMKLGDWRGMDGRRAEATARGCLRGIGMSTYVEAAAGGDDEEASIAFEDDGTVSVRIGTQSAGQGHETAYAQIAAGGLGVPFETVRVIQGDTDRVRRGRGTGGSRSLPVGGGALNNAVAEVVAKGRTFAAHLLQVPGDAVEFADGRFAAAGQGDGVGMGVLELAAAARIDENRPAGMDAGLDASARYKPQAPTFPNGCHVCEVEIDGGTGVARVVGYTVVDDFGTIINPLLLGGQIHGGVAQGIGQALLERAAYDPETGQLLSASFADYALPRADDLPAFDLAFNALPTANNPLGAKGAGEAGAIAACAAVVNALVDALAPLNVRHIDMPVTAEKIWRAMTMRATSGETT